MRHVTLTLTIVATSVTVLVAATVEARQRAARRATTVEAPASAEAMRIVAISGGAKRRILRPKVAAALGLPLAQVAVTTVLTPARLEVGDSDMQLYGAADVLPNQGYADFVKVNPNTGRTPPPPRGR